MNGIDQLKQEIAELEAQTQAQLQTEAQEPATETSASFPQRPKTLKELFDPNHPWRLKNDALLATATDESLPEPQRIKAAVEWRERLTPTELRHWQQYKDEELPERLTPHPHREKLKQLHDFVFDILPEDNGFLKYRPVEGDIEVYIRSHLEAIHEFNRLANEFPKRNEGVPIFKGAAEYVARQAKDNDPQHGKTRDTYCFVLRRAGFKV